MPCTCGYSNAYPACDGTHQTVKMVRQDLAAKVEEMLNKTEGPINREELISLIKKGR